MYECVHAVQSAATWSVHSIMLCGLKHGAHLDFLQAVQNTFHKNAAHVCIPKDSKS